MPISISDFLKVDPRTFQHTGAFDALLDVDSLFFIDPHLLKVTRARALRRSYAKVTDRFVKILKLLKKSRHPGDIFWRQAERLFMFPELQGLCIGYSGEDTSGSGMGQTLRSRVLATAKEIIEAGIDDPEIFELVGLFEEDVGPDRISDMLGRIIIDDLLKYSEQIVKQLDVEAETIDYRGFQVLRNPYNHQPLVFVPSDILNDLPVAQSRSDIPYVASFNREVRDRVNATVGKAWRRAVRPTKRDVRNILLEDGAKRLRRLIAEYRRSTPKPYDFQRDPAGEVVWYEAAKRAIKEYPLDLLLSRRPKVDEVLGIVLKICNRFKELIENHGLNSLLYDKGKPKHETAAQKLFYGIADAYCASNNLDLSPSSNGGRGPVDFKISAGYQARVVVETKLSSNKRLIHGVEVQVGEYEKGENTKHAVYLVIIVSKKARQIERLRALEAAKRATRQRMPKIVYVDALPKVPASKFQPAQTRSGRMRRSHRH